MMSVPRIEALADAIMAFEGMASGRSAVSE